MSAPRVLYIAGMMRCGSTLLGNVLNEVPGVLHVGELHYLWRNGLLGAGTNSSCGCGEDLTACPLWGDVLADPAVRGDAEGAAEVVAAQDRHLAHARTVARVAELARGTAPAEGVDVATGAMAAVYHRLAGDSSLIVDGSKYPAEAAALAARGDLDVRVLHMVRDARATVHSYAGAKSYIDGMEPRRAAALWSEVNTAADRLEAVLGERYLRIRHEDLGADPAGTTREVLRFAGVDAASPVDDDGRVTLRGNHTVTGNPDRLERGEVPVRASRRWVDELDTATRALVTFAAAPGLHRYGYLDAVPHRAPVSPAVSTGGR